MLTEGLCCRDALALRRRQFIHDRHWRYLPRVFTARRRQTTESVLTGIVQLGDPSSNSANSETKLAPIGTATSA
jgi:hypothetical protein